MVLENYVKLIPDKEKVLKFRPDSWRIEETTITDPVTKQPKRVRRVVLDVVEEDYRPVTKTFSVLAEKLAATLAAAKDNGNLYRYRVGITWHPQGLAAEYTVRFI